MQANSKQVNLNYDRQKDYLRQQERLKAMANTPDKVTSISADLMIENLLKNPTKILKHNERSNNCLMEIPQWLQCDSPTAPEEYKYLWSLVQSSIDLADTQKVSHLLLTSGLNVDILGYIWNLANRTIPGQLTKQEFYIVLALIFLAQKGYKFDSLKVLKLIPAPSAPVLQVDVFKKQYSQPFNSFQNPSSFNYNTPNSLQLMSASMIKENVSVKCPSNLSNGVYVGQKPEIINNYCAVDKTKDFISYDKSEANTSRDTNKYKDINEFYVLSSDLHSNSNFPCIGSSPTTELENDFSDFQSVPADKIVKEEKNFSDLNDEFTDFQSASSKVVEQADPFETIIISQKREIPKISLPKSFAGKLSNLKSNILKISPESERKLKILSSSESLSSLPESKISTTNQVSTSISVLGSNHGIGSRLANHSLNIKLDKPKIHKHHRNKSNPTPPVQSNDEEIIFGVKTKNLESVIPKCCPKKSVFILKETKINDGEPSELKSTEQSACETNASSMLGSSENTRKIEIPLLGTFNETVLPTQSKLQPCTVDLISVEEDKYSALREIEVEMAQSKIDSSDKAEPVIDDFGDFLSANIPPPIFDKNIYLNDSTNVSSNLLKEESDNDNWGEWSSNKKTNSERNDQNSQKIIDETEPTDKSNADFFNLLYKEDSNNIMGHSACQAPLQLETDTKNETVVSNNSEFAFALESVYDRNEKTENEPNNFEMVRPSTTQASLSNKPDDELWDFLAAPTKPATDSLNRHDSIPSLDFKMFSNEECDKEIIWKKCLTLCQLIIQEAVDIFDSIVQKPVIEEVFREPKTSNYLNGLKIVYHISRRINLNYQKGSSICEDLEKLWSRLEGICVEYNIKLKPDEDTMLQGEENCKICFAYVGNDIVTQGNFSYHPSCANLWVNCIDKILPAPS